jgi:hypothetical protein
MSDKMVEEMARAIYATLHHQMRVTGTDAQELYARAAQAAATIAERRMEEMREALDWFGTDTRLSLEHCSPVYGDDDDQAVEWRVHREAGSINDREWDIVGRGETPLAAIIDARAALRPSGGV